MITGTISPADYVHAQQLHRRRLSRWSYGVSALAAIGGAAGFVWTEHWLALALAGGGIGTAIAEWVIARIVLPWRARRMHGQHRDLRSPFTYTWDSEFLQARGAHGQARRSWRDYAKYKEDDKVILLYQTDNLYEMFPKRWFADAEALAEFRRLAASAGTG